MGGNLSTLSEPVLLDRCLKGDERAWEELYRRYHGLVRKVVTWQRWNLPYRESEDLVQDVFLELVRALPHFRGQASLSTFITRLAKNKCVSLLRQKLAQKRAGDGGVSLDDPGGEGDSRPPQVADLNPGPEEALVRAEEIEALLSCLGELGPECQEVIRQRYFLHLSYAELCQALELPLGTLCSRLKRCLTRLRLQYQARQPAWGNFPSRSTTIS